MRVYCIYDDVSDCLVNVFCSINDETAERSFLMLLTGSEDTLFTRFPEQFSLCYVGDIVSPSQVPETPTSQVPETPTSPLPTSDFAGFPCLVYPTPSNALFHALSVIRRGSEYGKRWLENERRSSHINTSVFDNNEEVSKDE